MACGMVSSEMTTNLKGGYEIICGDNSTKGCVARGRASSFGNVSFGAYHSKDGVKCDTARAEGGMRAVVGMLKDLLVGCLC